MILIKDWWLIHQSLMEWSSDGLMIDWSIFFQKYFFLLFFQYLFPFIIKCQLFNSSIIALELYGDKMFATHWRFNFGVRERWSWWSFRPFILFFFCSGKEKLKCYRLGMPTKQKNSGLFFFIFNFFGNSSRTLQGCR